MCQLPYLKRKNQTKLGPVRRTVYIRAFAQLCNIQKNNYTNLGLWTYNSTLHFYLDDIGFWVVWHLQKTSYIFHLIQTDRFTEMCGIYFNTILSDNWLFHYLCFNFKWKDIDGSFSIAKTFPDCLPHSLVLNALHFSYNNYFSVFLWLCIKVTLETEGKC